MHVEICDVSCVLIKTVKTQKQIKYKKKVLRCVKDIDWWMTNNMLKLNQEKTKLIVISSKFRPKPAISYVSVGDEQILPNLQLGFTVSYLTIAVIWWNMYN